ncbi:MAG: amidohydrolase family protein, partial [Phycisphaeraceae bacterium]|nr:amidohydrolase family protein [Phycisphaeraceae bacterium]
AEKAKPFEEAPLGIIGVETALPIYVETLVATGAIDWPRLIALMTIEPARLLGIADLGFGGLAVGSPADVTVIDPNERWTIAADDFESRSRNCPFDGRDVQGRAVLTLVDGHASHDRLTGAAISS